MTAGRTVNSQSVRWCTPRRYVDAITRVLGDPVALDPCSDEYSIIPARTCYMLPHSDGLRESWEHSTIFVNPPYGADRERGTTIRHWLRRCMCAHLDYDAEVLALVPIAANTRHWKESVWGRASALCFLYDTRLRFLEDGCDQGKGAPMACAMIYWGHSTDHFIDVFTDFGAAINIRELHGRRLGNLEESHRTLFSNT